MTTKKWNVMVYMAADNSLSEECVFSLKEMQRIGTAEGVNVIAQFHSSAKGAKPSRYPIRSLSKSTTSSRARVQKASNSQSLIGADVGNLESISKKDISIPPKSLRKLAAKLAEKKAAVKSDIAEKYTVAAAVQAVTAEMTDEELLRASNVTKLLNASNITKEELLSASNPDVLEEFLQSNIDANSAKNTNQLVILSGHGSGAVGPFLKSSNPPASLKVTDLRKIFRNVRKTLRRNIDIVMMDSCVMSMAEVAHELSGFANLLIGAEGFELSTGWPYHRILEALNAASQKETDSVTLARELVGEYVRYYSDYAVGGVSVDQAVCDLKQSSALANAVKGLKEALSNGIKQEITLKQEPNLKQKPILNAVLLAHWHAQSYRAERYVDLWDFCDQLIKANASTEIGDEANKEIEKAHKEVEAACRTVMGVIKGDNSDPNNKIPPFVLRSCYSGAAFQHSHGVSIYFPWAADTQKVEEFEELVEYKKLKFHDDTRWGDFITEYLEASRRPVRNDENRGKKDLLCFIPTDETRLGLRILEPGSKGGSETAAKVKNPPVEFFGKTCP